MSDESRLTPFKLPRPPPHLRRLSTSVSARKDSSPDESSQKPSRFTRVEASELQTKLLLLEQELETCDQTARNARTSETEPEHPEIPVLAWCPKCCREVTTSPKFVNTQKTFWSSVAIFFTGGVAGCCLVPYVTSSCKGVKHECANCHHELIPRV